MITEVDLSAFVYRLFHEDFSPIIRSKFVPVIGEIFMKQSVNKCRYILTSVVLVHKAFH